MIGNTRYLGARHIVPIEVSCIATDHVLYVRERHGAHASPIWADGPSLRQPVSEPGTLSLLSEESFLEHELDQQAKKTVLRQFTYGLVAVTAEHDGERGVFTANWLSQASFEPPLVMLSVERDSSTLPLIRASGRFALCPLDAGQKELAGALGRPKARAGDKYAAYDLAVVETTSGSPALAAALGYVVCRVDQEVPAGDSVVFVAKVVEARVLRDGEPLTMRAAGFRHAG